MNYDKLVEKFVGKEKIQALNIIKKKGKWVLRYKEGKKIQELPCKSRESLDKLLIEFGGKNPETCKTESKFLRMDGSWGSEDFKGLGHRLVRIAFEANRIARKKVIPFELPKGTGHRVRRYYKHTKKDTINLIMRDSEAVNITRSFKRPTEFDVFMEYIFNNASISELKWYVSELYTETSSGDVCFWKRCKANDGTRRMVLELRELNGRNYTKCVRQDLYDAAGDMFDSPCKSITGTREKVTEEKVCLMAAEDGRINLDNFEVKE